MRAEVRCVGAEDALVEVELPERRDEHVAWADALAPDDTGA